MFIGVAQIDLHLPESQSLKNKRVILKSLKDRISHTFNVSVAEVDFQDLWQRAALGIAVISNDGRLSDSMLAKIIELVKQCPLVVLVDYKTEIINASL